MPASPESYAARLAVDYPDRLDRLTTFFRLICAIPIAIVLGLLCGGLWLATIATRRSASVSRPSFS